MAERTPVVPWLLRNKIAQLGPAGERWLAGLADLITALEQQWSIRVVEPLSDGSAAYVARVRTGDGGAAVLKLAIPGTGFAGQARTLEMARGRGYAALLACDVGREAMLLEALGPSMSRLALPPEEAIALLGRLLPEAWQVPRPAGVVVPPEGPPGQEKAGQLAQMVAELWEALGRPCSERVVRRALDFARRRSAAFDPERCVVVHGDPHPGNALRVPEARAGAESGFVLIDPDGFLAEPACDLGVVLRDWCRQLLAGDPVPLARRYCRLLADGTGVDASAIWEWGFLERVSTGLYIWSLGAEDLARPFLATAELLV
jgi:streptomycin 6-kinase